MRLQQVIFSDAVFCAAQRFMEDEAEVSSGAHRMEHEDAFSHEGTSILRNAGWTGPICCPLV